MISIIFCLLISFYHELVSAYSLHSTIIPIRIYRDKIISSAQLMSTNNKKGNESSDKKTRGIVIFNEQIISDQWNVSISNSLNSTTMRILFGIQTEISSFIARIEDAVLSFTMRFTSKIERDIKTTSKASDYVVRRAQKDTGRLFLGVSSVSRSMLELPAAITSLTNGSTNFELILKSGRNPFEKPKLIGNFATTSTKERARKRQTTKKKEQPLAADTIYRSMRTLPAQLQYDYSRRILARESNRDVDIGQNVERMLPRGDEDEESTIIEDFNSVDNSIDSTTTIDSGELEMRVDALQVLSSELNWLQTTLLVSLKGCQQEYEDSRSTKDESNDEAGKQLNGRIGNLKRVTKSLETSLDAARLLSQGDHRTINELTDDDRTDCLALISCLSALAQLPPDIQSNERVQVITSILMDFDAMLKPRNSTGAIDIEATEALPLTAQTWTPAIVTLSDMFPINEEEEVRITSRYMLPEASKVRRMKVKTFQEFLEREGEEDMFDEELSEGRNSNVDAEDVEERGEEPVQALVVETTAVVEEDTKDEKAVKFIVSTLDVTFFLLEAMAKSIVPIFVDGGSLALARIGDTLVHGRPVKVPYNAWVAARSNSSTTTQIGPNSKQESIEEKWRLFDTLAESKQLKKSRAEV